VKVTLIPSAVSESEKNYQFLSSYLIDETVAIDAGSLGLYRSPGDQARVRNVFLTHTHIDHLASLPIFLENVFEAGSPGVTIHGTPAVLDGLRRDIFNDRVWPDFVALSTADAQLIQLATLTPGTTVSLDGLRFTPVEVNHVVPTVGFIVEDATSAVVIASDTGPTTAIWERARQTPNLKAVFLEATFPNSMAWLATAAKHHTPATFSQEIRQLQRQVQIIAVHLKARFYDEVVSELRALNLPGLEIARYGTGYDF
jgi:ribonuclease BN (tRNA processing enzyme)